MQFPLGVDVWIFVPHILGDTTAASSISITLFVSVFGCYDGGKTGFKCAVLCNVFKYGREVEGGGIEDALLGITEKSFEFVYR